MPTAVATMKLTAMDQLVTWGCSIPAICSCMTPINAAPPTPNATPIKPPSPESTVVSTTNWATMCVRVAPTARRIPISRVRSVDRSEHDVHNPDAADQQADTRDRHQKRILHDARALLLFEQFQRDDDFDIVSFAVFLIHDQTDLVADCQYVDILLDLNIDLTEFDQLALERARTHLDDAITPSPLPRW